MFLKEDLKNLSINDFKKFEGINWEHGKHDCYSLIRQVYDEIFDIKLSDYDRPDFWWKYKNIYNLYEDNYEKEGFIKIEISNENPLQIGDIFLMDLHVGVPVHSAIYVGNNNILHHMLGKLSCIETYNNALIQTTVKTVRHKNFL